MGCGLAAKSAVWEMCVHPVMCYLLTVFPIKVTSDILVVALKDLTTYAKYRCGLSIGTKILPVC